MRLVSTNFANKRSSAGRILARLLVGILYALPSRDLVAGERVSVLARQMEPDYPEKPLSDIRLCRNRKLAQEPITRDPVGYSRGDGFALAER